MQGGWSHLTSSHDRHVSDGNNVRLKLIKLGRSSMAYVKFYENRAIINNIIDWN
jgi:hypothetical protein